MTEAGLARDLTERLRGRPLPEDLVALVTLQAGTDPDAHPADHPLALTETWLLSPVEHGALLEQDYLTDSDRANPDIMANVVAINEVLGHGAWVVRTFNGDVAGYWLHPEEPADRPAAIVRYDTEGVFTVLPGRTLVEALIYNMAHEDDDEIAALAAAFTAYGLPVNPSRSEDLPDPIVAVDPVELHHRRYYAERAARGLPEIF